MKAKTKEPELSDYLQKVLKHIAGADTLEQLEAILTWHMKSTHLRELLKEAESLAISGKQKFKFHVPAPKAMPTEV